MGILLVYPIFIINSHRLRLIVFLAIQRWPSRKSSTGKRKFDRNYEDQFRTIFGDFANKLRFVDQLSTAIVLTASYAALFGMRNISVPAYSVTSPIQTFSSKPVLEQLELQASLMHKHFNQLACQHRRRFPSNEVLELYLNGDVLFDIEGTSGSITGSGGLEFAQSDIDSIRSMTNYVTFLKSVDANTNKGVVTVLFIYSPYDDVEWGSDIASTITAKTVSVDIEVDLTRDGDVDGVVMLHENPLYSAKACTYISKEWLDKIALWTKPVLRACESALDRKLYGSNNSLEGKFNHEKNLDSRFDDACSSTGELMNKRWTDGRGQGRMLDIQVRQSPAKIGKATQKRRRRATHPNAKYTFKQNQDGVQWSRGKTSIVKRLSEYRENMERAIIEAHRNGDLSEDKWAEWAPQNMPWNLKTFAPHQASGQTSNKRKIMEAFAASCGLKFISNGTFNNWMTGRRKKKLPHASERAIDLMFRKYCVDPQQPNDSDASE